MKLGTGVGLLGISSVGLFAVGFTFRDIERGKLPTTQPFRKLVGDQPAAQPEVLVKHNYNLIEDQYYRAVKPTPLKYAAIGGMISSLGDPHTVFLPPREKADFEFTTTAKFVGIGCALDPDPLGVRIASVFEDSPAEKSGLKSGDLLTAVNGVSIAGKPREKVVDQIRGKEGTIVKLTVIRVNQKTPSVVSVKRAAVQTPTVQSAYLEKSQMGYLQVTTFSEPTVEQFDAKLAKLRAHPLKGLIIDMRSNPGGLLETAVEMLARFAENKTVVKMRQRDGSEEVATTPSGYKLAINCPIAILINEDSASAAEIFSGVMHDYGLATLVGTHSYGKESVQNIFPMIDSAGVKVTIARYYLPVTPDFGRKEDLDGQYVSGGLKPEVYVKLDPDARPELGKPETDNQLAKAVEVLQGHR